MRLAAVFLTVCAALHCARPGRSPDLAVPGAATEKLAAGCVRGGGQWRDMTDACADSCASARQEALVCAQVITQGCDCGPERCWAGTFCEKN